MKSTILLNYGENTHQVEEEMKSIFLKGFLEQCFENSPDVAVQFSTIWSGDGLLPPPQKVKLRGLLATYGIHVIDDHDGHLQIYLDNELVGEWFKSTYKLNKDLRVTDPRHRIYLEMEVNCWSAFDQPDNQ
jgi:hypothetical protein